jgi:hypothetical protein
LFQTVQGELFRGREHVLTAVLGDWKMPEKNLGLKGRHLRGGGQLSRIATDSASVLKKTGQKMGTI